MTETTDGFKIAEADLRLRGPGDIEGTAQSGTPLLLKIANLTHDAPIMATARKAAELILEQDPYENLPQNEALWRHLRTQCTPRKNFSQIS